MKIIQGKYKGTNLSGFDIVGTRPTMDRVKESLFAIIQEQIPHKNILDLFAGSGNLGIEALSMGSEDVVFVDNNKVAINTIKKNLAKIKENRLVLNMDYNEALEYFYNQGKKFDIIFLDPPYNTNYIEHSLSLIENYNLLNSSGIVVCESDDLSKIKYSTSFIEYKSRKYGQKNVVILKKK